MQTATHRTMPKATANDRSPAVEKVPQADLSGKEELYDAICGS